MCLWVSEVVLEDSQHTFSELLTAVRCCRLIISHNSILSFADTILGSHAMKLFLDPSKHAGF